MDIFRRIILVGFPGLALALGVFSMPLAFAYASGTVSVQSLSPGSSVAAGNAISFSVLASGFTNPLFSLSDAASNSSILSGNLNTYSGFFSWQPAASDIGTHLLTIRAYDSSGNSASATQQITVTPAGSPSLALQSISVPAGQALSFSVAASNFSATTYSVSDNFSGSSLIANAINSQSGQLTWTPKASDVGTHVLNIAASDTSGHSANIAETVTVTAPVPAPQNQSPAPASPATPPVTAPVAAPTGANTSSPDAASAMASSHSSSYQFTLFLSVGSTGTEVTELQKKLTALALYSGPITGRFGALTRAAVEKFQLAHGIRTAGYVGPGTRKALNS